MSNYKEGDRVLLERNGVQFAGTIESNGICRSDIDGSLYSPFNTTVIRKLEGLEAMKTGDIIVDTDGNESKVLAIDNHHTCFLISYFDDKDGADDWYTFTKANRVGWKLKDQPISDTVEITIAEIAKLKCVDVERIRVKDE